MFHVINLNKAKKFLKIIVVLLVTAAGVFVGFKAVFPLKFVDLIYMYSIEYNVPAELICAIINAESGFDSDAKSPKGARGLMQIMKQTADWAAEEINIENYDYNRICEPELNIRIGCWYMAKLLRQYDNNTQTALAAYNAGSGNVSGWLEAQGKKGIEGWHELDSIPFGETKRYVDKVTRYTKVYEFLLGLN